MAQEPGPSTPATIVLFIVIAVVMISLAAFTEVSTPVRWLVSIASGMVAAAAAHAVTRRRRT